MGIVSSCFKRSYSSSSKRRPIRRPVSPVVPRRIQKSPQSRQAIQSPHVTYSTKINPSQQINATPHLHSPTTVPDISTNEHRDHSEQDTTSTTFSYHWIHGDLILGDDMSRTRIAAEAVQMAIGGEIERSQASHMSTIPPTSPVSPMSSLSPISVMSSDEVRSARSTPRRRMRTPLAPLKMTPDEHIRRSDALIKEIMAREETEWDKEIVWRVNKKGKENEENMRKDEDTTVDGNEKEEKGKRKQSCVRIGAEMRSGDDSQNKMEVKCDFYSESGAKASQTFEIESSLPDRDLCKLSKNGLRDPRSSSEVVECNHSERTDGYTNDYFVHEVKKHEATPKRSSIDGFVRTTVRYYDNLAKQADVNNEKSFVMKSKDRSPRRVSLWIVRKARKFGGIAGDFLDYKTAIIV